MSSGSMASERHLAGELMSGVPSRMKTQLDDSEFLWEKNIQLIEKLFNCLARFKGLSKL